MWLYSYEREANLRRETSDDRLWWGFCEQEFSDDLEGAYQNMRSESTHVRHAVASSSVILVDLDNLLQEDETGTVRRMRRVLVEEGAVRRR